MTDLLRRNPQLASREESVDSGAIQQTQAAANPPPAPGSVRNGIFDALCRGFSTRDAIVRRLRSWKRDATVTALGKEKKCRVPLWVQDDNKYSLTPAGLETARAAGMQIEAGALARVVSAAEDNTLNTEVEVEAEVEDVEVEAEDEDVEVEEAEVERDEGVAVDNEVEEAEVEVDEADVLIEIGDADDDEIVLAAEEIDDADVEEALEQVADAEETDNAVVVTAPIDDSQAPDTAMARPAPQRPKKASVGAHAAPAVAQESDAPSPSSENAATAAPVMSATTAPVSKDDGTDLLRPGQRVKAKYLSSNMSIRPTKSERARGCGPGRWYEGVIRDVDDDGTCIIDYDDGETEAGVLPEFIQLISGKDTGNGGSDNNGPLPAAVISSSNILDDSPDDNTASHDTDCAQVSTRRSTRRAPATMGEAAVVEISRNGQLHSHELGENIDVDDRVAALQEQLAAAGRMEEKLREQLRDVMQQVASLCDSFASVDDGAPAPSTALTALAELGERAHGFLRGCPEAEASSMVPAASSSAVTGGETPVISESPRARASGSKRKAAVLAASHLREGPPKKPARA